MDEVISSYLTALDELNVLTSTSYQMAGGDYSARVNQIVDDVLSFLINERMKLQITIDHQPGSFLYACFC